MWTNQPPEKEVKILMQEVYYFKLNNKTMTFTLNAESLNTHKYEIVQDLTQIHEPQLQALIHKLKTESALLTERLCVEDFQKLIQKNLLTAILDIDQNIIATAILWEVEGNKDWYEMGTVWVSPEHRGQQLGHKVFQSITAKVPAGSNAFLLTTTPQIIHSAQTFGYQYMDKEDFEQIQFKIEPPAEPQHQLYFYTQTNQTQTSTKLQTLRNTI